MNAPPTPSQAGPKAYRFGACELDEARRTLRVQEREIPLQPRVFEVLCYLVRHRERVVSKDELLGALWPGSVVVDNALQRTVSLARAALAEAGLEQAVRTYSRLGYRFCAEDCREQGAEAGDAAVAAAAGAPRPASAPASPASSGDAVPAAAQAACDRHDWAAACAAFAEAEALSLLSPQQVEEWGRAAICGGLGGSVLVPLERAVARHAEAGDARGAARAALLLVQIRSDRMEAPLARGLLRRAERYLEGLPACVEHGHCAWMGSRLAMMGADLPTALRHADTAVALGRELRDTDVECLGLSYRGHVLMQMGDFAAGIAHHEEAAAAIRLGGVSLWVGGWLYCSVLTASRNRCDWLRAAQWTQAFAEWCRSSNMPAFPGTCQVYRAEVMGVRGELDAAAAELGHAVGLLAQAAPWAEGDAHRVLGEVRLTCGDLDGAAASFRRAHALGWDPQPGLARLQLAAGQPQLALRGLEQALAESDWALRERRGQLLCLLALAAVEAGDPERARTALQTLEGDPQLLATEALQAMGCRARAELAWHGQQRAGALQRLRQAVRQWHAVGSPPNEADARLRLAQWLLEEGDAVAAELELHAVESLPVLAAAQGLRRRAQALREALPH